VTGIDIIHLSYFAPFLSTFVCFFTSKVIIHFFLSDLWIAYMTSF